jgi:2-iminobutanoate/2-iminopropanoate deaminase
VSAATRTVVETRGAPRSAAYSQAVKAGGLVFVSGTVGIDPLTGELAGAGVGEQVAQAIRNCEAILHAAGASLADVVEVQALLADPADFAAFNAAYAPFFPAPPPARSVAKLGVELPGLRVSIRMVAAAR